MDQLGGKREERNGDGQPTRAHRFDNSQLQRMIHALIIKYCDGEAALVPSDIAKTDDMVLSLTADRSPITGELTLTFKNGLPHQSS
jgi:hypothetical protein